MLAGMALCNTAHDKCPANRAFCDLRHIARAHRLAFFAGFARSVTRVTGV